MSSSPTPEGPGSVSGAPSLPAGFTVKYYIDILRSDPDALRGGFGFSRAVNHQRAERAAQDPAPDRARPGDRRRGRRWRRAREHDEARLRDVQTVVLAGSGHWVAEQAPEELLEALTAFLALYRDGENRK